VSAHLILLDLIILIILDKEYKSCSSSLCSFLHPSITPSYFRSNILLSTLFSNTLSLCSSLNVRNQVSHPYKTIGKVIVLCILIFKFFDSRQAEISFWTEKQQTFPDFSLHLIFSWIKLWSACKIKFWRCLKPQVLDGFYKQSLHEERNFLAKTCSQYFFR
jgi:hypothetical protein